jgi:NAD+ synthetase
MGVAMPGPYSSEGSLIDARHTAESLGIRFEVLDINEAYSSFETKLAGVFAGTKQNTAEENLQARLRGNTLMALSNKFGGLVLTTGNKSELAVGYCTLYGDMAGGLAVISDLPKTLVYDVSRWLNRDRELIPADTISKPPSAELAPDQLDTDSLPPYPALDAILHEYIEEAADADTIRARTGIAAETISRVIRMVDRNEFKRRQAAPGLRVTSKAFGSGRRFPVAARFEFD